MSEDNISQGEIVRTPISGDIDLTD